MTLTRLRFEALLRVDEDTCFPWELIPPEEREERHLAAPATYLGCGAERFWRLLAHLEDAVADGARICDFGAYPGTTFRLVDRLWPGHEAALAAAGFKFSDDFVSAMVGLGVDLLEMEFDARPPMPNAAHHILNFPIDAAGGTFDVALCTEVIEHQIQPLFLLAGLNRFLRPGGTLLLSTNSASFIGDILKLTRGRHNVESLDRSHVLADDQWRPHIRLYTLDELRQLLVMCGFELQDAKYFDNGNIYRGPKGLGMSALRRTVGVVPHLRSHVWLTARRVGPVSAQVAAKITGTLQSHDLEQTIGRVEQSARLTRPS